MVAHCFESDPCTPPALVHGTHPGWTRLELAKGVQGTFRVARDPPGTAARSQLLTEGNLRSVAREPNWERQQVPFESLLCPN